MANRRTLKKQINIVCGSLLVECVATSHFMPNVPRQEIDDMMVSVLNLQDDMIRRVSHVEPGMKPSIFFKKMRQELGIRTEEIMNQLFAIA